jgi:hypothetical protein
MFLCFLGTVLEFHTWLIPIVAARDCDCNHQSCWFDSAKESSACIWSEAKKDECACWSKSKLIYLGTTMTNDWRTSCLCFLGYASTARLCFFPKSKALFSVASTFGPTRSTCELNHCWRNMSENMTWWNQLPVDKTASHPTITSRALPMMWPIIHQCTIWEFLMNQFWMSITEWPRFLHPLVGYPLNPPLST